MGDRFRRPSAITLRDFSDRLSAFRQTLSPEHQMYFDALVLAALRPEALQDLEPYRVAMNCLLLTLKVDLHRN